MSKQTREIGQEMGRSAVISNVQNDSSQLIPFHRMKWLSVDALSWNHPRMEMVSKKNSSLWWMIYHCKLVAWLNWEFRHSIRWSRNSIVHRVRRASTISDWSEIPGTKNDFSRDFLRFSLTKTFWNCSIFCLFKRFDMYLNNFQIVVFPDKVFPSKMIAWRERWIVSKSITFSTMLFVNWKWFSLISISIALINWKWTNERWTTKKNFQREKKTSAFSIFRVSTFGKRSSINWRKSKRSSLVIFGTFISKIDKIKICK